MQPFREGRNLWALAAEGGAIALAIIALLYVGAVFLLASQRIPYPFELEWMEGGSLSHLARIMAGERLYVAPSLDFVPFLYPPLYYYCAAPLALIFGVGFTPLRLVSLLASLGTIGLIYRLVSRETAAPFAGLLAAGLYAATFRVGGAWFDVARVDSLFLFWALLGAYGCRFAASPGAMALAGACLALAFFTKQTALVIAVPLTIYVAWTRPAWLKFFLGAWLGLVIGGSLALDALHGGWYRYYVFDLVGGHALAGPLIVRFWTQDLVAPLAIALSVGGFYLVDGTWGDRRFMWALGGALIGVSWLGRMNFGGYDNVLLPAFAAVAIAFGLGTHTLRERLRTLSGDRRFPYRAFLHAVLLLQFIHLAYNPLRQMPTLADKATGLAFVESLARLPGDVFLPHHPYLLALAGKKDHAHGMAVIEVLWSRHRAGTHGLEADLLAALQQKRYSTLVLDGPFPDPAVQRAIDGSYRRVGPALPKSASFWTLTGMLTRPTWIYTPMP